MCLWILSSELSRSDGRGENKIELDKNNWKRLGISKSGPHFHKPKHKRKQFVGSTPRKMAQRFGVAIPLQEDPPQGVD
jgi:hypothetical protein